MSDINHLIEQLWQRKMTPEQKSTLYHLIQTNEDGLRKHLSEEYIEELKSSLNSSLTDNRSNEILKEIHQQISNRQPFWQREYVSVMRYAAAFILLIATVVSVFFIAKNDSESTSQIADRGYQQISNNTDTVKTLSLADGSVIRLYPLSSVSYHPQFVDNRKLVLTGVARITVAHNAISPFRVVAKGFTTTALGTEFLINAKRKDSLSVTLFEGKLLVKPNKGTRAKMQNIYLESGNVLNINVRNGDYVLEPLKAQSSVDGIDNAIAPTNSITKRTNLNFYQTPLTEVFDVISKEFDVSITYRATDNNLRFTGSFNNSASLKKVVETVCRLNDLIYTRKNDSIIISTKK